MAHFYQLVMSKSLKVPSTSFQINNNNPSIQSKELYVDDKQSSLNVYCQLYYELLSPDRGLVPLSQRVIHTQWQNNNISVAFSIVDLLISLSFWLINPC